MNDKDLYWINDALAKVKALDKFSEARCDGMRVVIKLDGTTPSLHGHVVLPYSSISNDLERTRHNLAAMLKVRGYDGPETEGVEMVTDGDGRRTAKAAPIILSEEEVAAEDSEDRDQAVHVPGAKFPLYWDKEYYIAGACGKVHACGMCNGSSRLQNDVCPACHGWGRVADYKVKQFTLDAVMAGKTRGKYAISFKGTESDWMMQVRTKGLGEMRAWFDHDTLPVHVYETREEAQAEADRLNAAIREEAVK